MEKLKLRRALVVEGRYDAARLAGLVDGTILTTGGFDIYTDEKKKALLRRLAQRQGLLLLLDSDAAGFQIRTYIQNLAGPQRVRHAYIPARAGKERRKQAPGKEGLLGVEGIDDATLRRCLEDALSGEDVACELSGPAAGEPITYADLYRWGLSGRPDSAARRRDFLRRLELPPRLSKKALVEVLNTLYTREELAALLEREENAAAGP